VLELLGRESLLIGCFENWTFIKCPKMNMQTSKFSKNHIVTKMLWFSIFCKKFDSIIFLRIFVSVFFLF
jgi:hypothetical protein